jgi:hypothetical protein
VHRNFICRFSIKTLQQLERIELSSLVLLTLHNYFESKLNILLILRRICLYEITMATKLDPDSLEEKNDFLKDKIWLSNLFSCLFVLNYNIM